MHEIKAKYNQAIIFGEYPEPETLKQIYTFLNHPAFKGGMIRIMPDHHKGSGSCIGYTQTLGDYIIPNVVGVDIGCSCSAYKIGKVKLDFESFDKFIRENIPSGFNHRSKVHKECVNFRNGESRKILDRLNEVSYRILNEDEKSILFQAGTLGSGNHALEVDMDPNENIWVFIHSGSRNFGLQVAKYHQNKAKELMKKMYIGDAYKDLEFLPMDIGGEEYLRDMEVAQVFAEMNHYIMAYEIVSNFFGKNLYNCESIKTVHNYINFKDNILRKGAVSAQDGERLLIPLNMRDGVIVATGKGNKNWNYSAPHGAGRVLSRSQAKKSVNLDDYKNSMEGIWSSCVNENTLDESPMAYKPQEIILEAIKDTVDVEFIMKPVYNFKAQG